LLSSREQQASTHIQSDITVHDDQSLMSRSQTIDTILLSHRKESLNEAYVEQSNADANLWTTTAAITKSHSNESTLKSNKQEENMNSVDSTVTSPSMITDELDALWGDSQHKVPLASATTSCVHHRQDRVHRPSSRLRKYDDESDSELTAVTMPDKHERT
jgi:hypothetical protein